MASEKERYESQIRAARAQREAKSKAIADLTRNRDATTAARDSARAEVAGLEQACQELEMTVTRINEAIASKKMRDEVVEQTNAQVQRVEQLRKEKPAVFGGSYHKIS